MNLNDFILPIVLLAPLVSMVHVFLLPSSNLLLVKKRSLEHSIVVFVLSLLLYVLYDKYNFLELFQFNFSLSWMSFVNLNFSYGADGVSIFFVILTSFLIPICIISSWESIKYRFKEFVLYLFLIEFLLFNVFCVLDLILFYAFFESVLIPMFIIIGVWGSRGRRIYASYQFFLYTFLGSVFMLLGIIYIYYTTGSTDYKYLLTVDFLPKVQIFLWLSFFMSFAVKVPIVPLHTWLPEAHVEAPTAGSVLLAGVLLKLGAYGLLRFSLPLFPYATHYFTPLVLTISVISIVYSSLTTLRQIDLKKVIAYSSVAHMNLVTIGIFSYTYTGINGAIALMLSHGIVSSGLFLCVGVIYDRYGTRLIKYYGGLVNFMPSYAIIFVILSLANMGFPGTSSFVGEMLIFLSGYSINSFALFLSCTSVVFSAAYSVWLCNRILFGPVNIRIQRYSDLNERENTYLYLMAFLVIFFGFYTDSIIEFLHVPSTFIYDTVYNFSAMKDVTLITSVEDFIQFCYSNPNLMRDIDSGVSPDLILDKYNVKIEI